jgi:hypothetical protein
MITYSHASVVELYHAPQISLSLIWGRKKVRKLRGFSINILLKTPEEKLKF